jgi:hypothetical protein
MIEGVVSRDRLSLVDLATVSDKGESHLYDAILPPCRGSKPE